MAEGAAKTQVKNANATRETSILNAKKGSGSTEQSRSPATHHPLMNSLLSIKSVSAARFSHEVIKQSSSWHTATGRKTFVSELLHGKMRSLFIVCCPLATLK